MLGKNMGAVVTHKRQVSMYWDSFSATRLERGILLPTSNKPCAQGFIYMASDPG